MKLLIFFISFLIATSVNAKDVFSKVAHDVTGLMTGSINREAALQIVADHQRTEAEEAAVYTQAEVKYNGPNNDQDWLLNVALAGSYSNVLTRVYNNADFNMDGMVKYNGPNNDQNFLLNIALGGAIAAVYKEQLF